MLQNALLILTLTRSHQHCVLPCSEGKPAPTPPGFHTHETLSPSQGQCPLGMLPCWGHSWINIFHSSASQGNSATEQTEEESKFPYLSASREVSSAPDKQANKTIQPETSAMLILTEKEGNIIIFLLNAVHSTSQEQAPITPQVNSNFKYFVKPYCLLSIESCSATLLHDVLSVHLLRLKAPNHYISGCTALDFQCYMFLQAGCWLCNGHCSSGTKL